MVRLILMLALSLASLACSCAPSSSPKPQDNVIILKHLRAELDPSWIILDHLPNGEYSSFVSAALTHDQRIAEAGGGCKKKHGDKKNLHGNPSWKGDAALYIGIPAGDMIIPERLYLHRLPVHSTYKTERSKPLNPAFLAPGCPAAAAARLPLMERLVPAVPVGETGS